LIATKNIGLHHLAIKVRSLEALQEAFDIVSKVKVCGSMARVLGHNRSKECL
jgi:hypothetical protein